MKSLSGKNILITGGAAGIGREMALLFAKEKACLVLMDVNRVKLGETEKEVAALGARVSSHVCDVSDPKGVERIARLVRKDTRIDVLVNNAGIVVGKSIADASFEEIKRTIDINLLGLIWMTKQFLPDMMARGSGHIVNIASAAGLLAVPRMGDYCASKFGVVGFSDSLRMEMKKSKLNIPVTCVCPSIIDTGMFAGFKAPLFNPVLKPDYVAKRVVDAVKREKSYVKLPAMVVVTPLLKLFPAPFGDWLARVTGVTRAMDHFVGH